MAGSLCSFLSMYLPSIQVWGFPSGSVLKDPPENAGDMGSIPGLERPLEKKMATHASILAWESHGQRSLVGYSPWGHKRVGHNLAIKQQHPKFE